VKHAVSVRPPAAGVIMINRGLGATARFAVFALLIPPAFGEETPRAPYSLREVRGPYNPTFNPADFTHVITNKYLILKAGTKATYEKISSKGIVHVEMNVSGKTKSVMRITTLVVRNREWLNDRMIEDTSHWVAQDRDENVWNFGEAVDHYKDGKLINHNGSWEAGVNGAKPGILMLGKPKVGDVYREEYYPGKAEDMRTVVAVGKTLAVPQGPFFENCVQIRDWSRINSSSAHKYYCVGVGLMVLEDEGAELLKLVGFSTQYVPNPRWARGSLASRK
jgi:hypothetical protein